MTVIGFMARGSTVMGLLDDRSPITTSAVLQSVETKRIPQFMPWV